MFGIFKKKSTTKKSVLSNQKPRRRRTKSKDGGSDQGGIHPGVKASIVIIGGVLLWVGFTKFSDSFERTYDRLTSALHMPAKNWEVLITDDEGTPLGEDLRKDIYRIALKTLHTGGPKDLMNLASGIEAIGSLEQVTVVRPRQQTIVVTASLRKPFLYVQAGSKVRYLTQDGTVYGDASEEWAAVTTLPNSQPTKQSMILLKGIFDVRPNTSPLHLDHSQRLVLTPEEKNLLLDGIGLYKQASKQALELKALDFQGYRGFALLLSDGTEVVLGQAPFDYKLEKLLSILGKLKSQGTTASRIELDYDGKAFIKERKL